MNTETRSEIVSECGRALWCAHCPDISEKYDQVKALTEVVESLQLRANFTRETFDGLGGECEESGRELAARYEGQAYAFSLILSDLQDRIIHEKESAIERAIETIRAAGEEVAQ